MAMRPFDFGEFEPKSYAYFEDSLGFGLKPIDVDAKTLIRLHSSAKGFTFRFGPIAAKAKEGESKAEFLLRCAAMGMSPDFEIVNREDEYGNTSDIIAVETGQSLNGLRAKACLEKANRIGGWEKAFLRVAKSLKCLVQWNCDDNFTSGPDDYRRPPAGCEAYSVRLALEIKGKTAFPAGIRLKLWNRRKMKFATVWPERSIVPVADTREKACRKALKAMSGTVVGVLDRKIPANPYREYALEKFVPVGTVPAFESRQELELRLAALGF